MKVYNRGFEIGRSAAKNVVNHYRKPWLSSAFYLGIQAGIAARGVG